MGSCRICGKELAREDSFVIVESPNDSKALARFHATLTQKTKIKELVKKGITQDDARCFECADLFIKELDAQITEAEFERNSYLNYLQDNESENQEEEKIMLTTNLKTLQNEERELLEQLEKIQSERIALHQVLEDCVSESKSLDEEDKVYWSDFANFEKRVYDLQNEHERIVGRNLYGTSELRKLEQKNVYQDTFYISTSGRIGTVNSFRLGRLSDAPVEWEEINAAWGQATLLLYIISKKGAVSLKQYRLRPMGNRSTIEETTKESVIPRDLWGSEDLGFGSWFWGFGKKTNNSFDDGMVSFLHCLRVVCERVSELATDLEIPYMIHGDKIGGQSIRMQSTTEESWTKALKHVLTNLNFLLAWTSSNNSKQVKK